MDPNHRPIPNKVISYGASPSEGELITANELFDQVVAQHEAGIIDPKVAAVANSMNRYLKASSAESKITWDGIAAIVDAKPNWKKLHKPHPHRSHPARRDYRDHGIFHKQRALYSPCDCGSGKLLKFCCRAEVQARIDAKTERPLRSVRWNSDTGMPPTHRGSTNMRTRAAKLQLWSESCDYMNEGAAVRRKLRADQPAGEAKGGRRQRRKARAKAAKAK